MSLPASLDLVLVRGDTEAYTFTVEAPAGTALNLTGYIEASFVVRPVWGDTAVITKTLGAGTTLVSPETLGQVLVDIAPADTSGIRIPAGRDGRWLVYDLTITRSDGAVITVSRGALHLLSEV